MKIAVVGDAHLCYRQYGLDDREKDFYLRWEQIIDNIINQKSIDMVLQLGDIFDTHIPSSIALHEYEKGVRKLLDDNIEYHSITGNHTIIRKKHNFMSPDDFFNQNLDITSLDDTHLIVDNVFIAGAKYRSESNKDELLEVIHEHEEVAKSFDGLKILLLHQAVDTDLLYGAELQENDLPTDTFDYIFIGHLHSRIQRKHGNCHIIYPGSIERSSTTEAKDAIHRGKGYYILDTDTLKCEFVNIDFYRNFMFMDIQNKNDISLLKRYVNDETCKPIVELTFKLTDMNIDEAYELGNVIADDCLKLNVVVLNDNVDDEDNERMVDDSISSIQNMLEQRLSKSQALFAYDLLQTFNKTGKLNDNIVSATELADEYFENNYEK